MLVGRAFVEASSLRFGSTISATVSFGSNGARFGPWRRAPRPTTRAGLHSRRRRHKRFRRSDDGCSRSSIRDSSPGSSFRRAFGKRRPEDSARCGQAQLVSQRVCHGQPLAKDVKHANPPPISLHSIRRTDENLLRQAGVDDLVRRSLAGRRLAIRHRAARLCPHQQAGA